jgi:CRP-like cAMP-binding protein
MNSMEPGMNNATARDASAPHNQLLAALHADEAQRWAPYLEPVRLMAGQMLCDSGDPPAFVHFPTSAVVSLLSTTRDGDSAELAVVGHDGMIGIAVFMGGNAMPCAAVVQASGTALRLRAPALKSLLQRSVPILQLLLRYAQALTAQVAQTALCNRYHSIDQQLSRRLLLGFDRSAGDALSMTHEDAARLLGVRREGITAAAHRLQQRGVIHYRRGRIRVLDRLGLEQHACECYASVAKEQSRLLAC